MKFRILAVVAVLLMVGVVAGVVYGERVSSNSVVYKHRLDPASRATQGVLQVVDKQGNPLGQCPLEHTSVKAQIAGFVARVDVVQEFVNPLNEPIEAVYIFPLPADCAVDSMEMTVGARVVRGQIKRKAEARQIYTQAKNAGQVASLLDQERPNIFTQSVANIMPGARVKIKISFVDVLKYEAGQYEFVFPMVVGPRYIPGQATGQSGTGWSPDTNRVSDASKITPQVTPEGTRAGHDVSVDVEINAGVQLGEIKSVLHDVDIDRSSDTEARITLKDLATIPNKDFILRYKVAGEEVRTGLLPNTRAAGDGYFSFVIVPPKIPAPAQITPKEMIFVIDTSGSQQGWPIEKAKETMKLCMQQMNPGDTFNMMAFSNDVHPLFDSPQPNTVENRAFAQEFLTSRLGSGGTEMLKAIDAALLTRSDPSRLKIVCFMTDGYVGNDFEILDAIQKKIGSARLYPFGIGNSVNRFLLDGMAKMGRGVVEYVTLQEEGKGAAGRFYNRIAKPVLTDITIDWGGLPVYDTYPDKIPDLFSSQPLVIQGRYDKAMTGTIVVRGRLGGRPWEERVPVTLPGRTDENQAVPALWARARIADLMNQDLMGMQRGNPDPKVAEDITQVALDYQLMSQYTSFVAVEEKVVNTSGKTTTVAVPVEMPDGVSREGVFGTKGDNRLGTDKSFALNSSIVTRSAPAAKTEVSGALSYRATYADGSVSNAPVMAEQKRKDGSNRQAGSNAKVPSRSASPGSNAVAASPAPAAGPAGPAGPAPAQSHGISVSGAMAPSASLSIAPFDADGKDYYGTSANERAKSMKPEDRRAYLIEQRLDKALRELPKKMQASKTANYVVPGKIEVVDGKVRVSILLTQLTDDCLAKLRAMGVKVSASSQMLGMVVGYVPVDKLEDLAQLEFILRIAPVAR